MRATEPEFKIGIMVAVGLTILGILIISAKGRYFFQKGYTIKVYFDYVSGLDPGAPVRLAGMKVGEVKDLALVDKKIEVTLKLKSTAKIRTDSIITINSLGIVGEKYIEITLGTPQGKILKPGSVIQGVNPVNVEEMLTRTEAVVYKSERIVAFMDKLLGGEEGFVELDKIVKNTAGFTGTLNKLLVENKDDINSTIKNLRSISTSLREIIRDNYDDFRITTKEFKHSAIQLNKSLANLDTAIIGTKKEITSTLMELNNTLDSIQGILKKVEKGEGAMGKLVSNKELADNLAKAAQNIEELTIDLKKHPWKLFKK